MASAYTQSRLPILLTAILLLFPRDVVAPLPWRKNITHRRKILIDFDVSGELPQRVDAIPSLKFSGGTHYTMKTASRHTHILGDIRDGKELIVEGDRDNMSRFVLVIPKKDGSKYIRTTTRKRVDNNYFNNVQEFLKKAGESVYTPITREKIEIEILTQNTNRLIQVEECLESKTKTFTIKPDMSLSATIGVVTYNGHIVDERIEGLMRRNVTFEEGNDNLHVTVESYFTDGVMFIVKYCVYADNSKNIHRLESKKKLIDLFE